MTAPVQFWFEFASTYSYPAAMTLEGRARELGVDLSWCPFLLGPIFQDQGWNDSPFNLMPAKGRYMWRDLERICERDGIPFRRPSVFPRRSLLAARVIVASGDAAWVPDLVRRLYQANFAEDRDIGDRTVVGEILDAVGAPHGEILEVADSDDVKADLRQRTDRARELGIFGAPAFVVGDELFWGQDRLDDALTWARRAS